MVISHIIILLSKHLQYVKEHSECTNNLAINSASLRYIDHCAKFYRTGENFGLALRRCSLEALFDVGANSTGSGNRLLTLDPGAATC